MYFCGMHHQISILFVYSVPHKISILHGHAVLYRVSILGILPVCLWWALYSVHKGSII